MYETVKTVKGKAIYRMKGTKGQYWVNIGKGKRMHFKTQKAAAAWINKNY